MLQVMFQLEYNYWSQLAQTGQSWHKFNYQLKTYGAPTPYSMPVLYPEFFWTYQYIYLLCI